MPPEYVLAVRWAASVQLEALEELLAPPPGLGRRHVVQPPDHLEVLQAGQVLVHRGVLPGEADHVPELLRLA